MNIFGYKFLTPRELEDILNEAVAAAYAAKQEEEEDDPSTLESAKFARVYNKGTAKEMLETIKSNAKDAERNSKIALYLSIPHQMGFLLGLVPLVFNSLGSVLGSITLLGMAIGLPYLCDRLILMCIRNIATRVVSTWDKAKAFLVLMPAIAVSVFLNIAAPGPELMKWVCGAVVTMVPLYQIIRSVRPNFKKAGADETKIRNEVAELAVNSSVSDAEREARRQRGIKAAATRAARASAAAQAAATPEVSPEEKEARRQRGLKAAATRAQRAETARIELEAAIMAAAKKRPSRAKAKVEETVAA